MPFEPQRILVIRRDNIGDLVCTTPLIAALRQRFPQARIHALVNSYNAPVLAHHPDVDQVHAYTKLKHRPPGQSALAALIDRVRIYRDLRRARLDLAILAAPGYLPKVARMARTAGARQVLGFVPADRASAPGIDLAVPYAREPRHEVEDVFRLLAPLGIEGEPPPVRLAVSPEERAQAQATLATRGWGAEPAPIAIHISARKPSNRWPMERYAELIRALHARHGERFLLFWSPGDSANPLHPGDDDKAAALLKALPEVPIQPFRTERLRELIAGLSLCKGLICGDGGHMHLAAGLGLPIVAFFGKSDAVRWRPWSVPQAILQPASMEASEIPVADALSAWERLTVAC